MRALGLSLAALALAACATAPAAGPPAAEAPYRTSADILKDSPAAAWRGLPLADTLIMTLAGDRQVVIELAPTMAPQTVDNIKTLVRQGFFDGLSVNRVQDNFVTQWGDPAQDDEPTKPIGAARETIPAEFDRPIAGGPAFTALPDGDVFAPEVGFVGGFPAARDPRDGRMWLTHCYAMVGVGRDTPADSGNGSALYAVIGHSPRQLDRNITVVGRVVWGMEHLSSLPRGTAALGFYDAPDKRLPITRVQMAADAPGGGVAGQLEALRTDTPTFAAVTEARRNRRDAWYKRPAGHIDLCNVLLPVRQKAG